LMQDDPDAWAMSWSVRHAKCGGHPRQEPIFRADHVALERHL